MSLKRTLDWPGRVRVGRVMASRVVSLETASVVMSLVLGRGNCLRFNNDEPVLADAFTASEAPRFEGD